MKAVDDEWEDPPDNLTTYDVSVSYADAERLICGKPIVICVDGALVFVRGEHGGEHGPN